MGRKPPRPGRFPGNQAARAVFNHGVTQLAIDPRLRGPTSDPAAEWMAAFSSGDEEAFERIVDAFKDSVLRFLCRRVRDADRAEDLLQEVFIRVYRARQGYRPTASFRTWLFTIANRLALNEIRAVRRRRRIFAPSPSEGKASEDDLSVDDFWANVADRDPTGPAEALERKELESVLEGLLESLPPNQRLAVELVSGDQLSYAEAAGVMGVSVAAVRSLLVRARQCLKDGLDRRRRADAPTDRGMASA